MSKSQKYGLFSTCTGKMVEIVPQKTYNLAVETYCSIFENELYDFISTIEMAVEDYQKITDERTLNNIHRQFLKWMEVEVKPITKGLAFIATTNDLLYPTSEPYRTIKYKNIFHKTI